MTERELELLFFDAIREMRDRGTIRFVELAANNSTSFTKVICSFPVCSCHTGTV